MQNVVLHARAADAASFASQTVAGDMSLDKADLVAMFLEALLYGKPAVPRVTSLCLLIFCCLLSGIEALTFVATVYLLHGAQRTKPLFVKFSAVIIMFLLNTIVSLLLSRILAIS